MQKDQLLDEFMFWLDMQDEDDLRLIVCETMSKVDPAPRPIPFMFRTRETPSEIFREFVARNFHGLPVASGLAH